MVSQPESIMGNAKPVIVTKKARHSTRVTGFDGKDCCGQPTRYQFDAKVERKVI